MKVFVSDRGMGKTTFLIEESAKRKLPILCTNNEQVQFIKRRADWMGIEIPEPISYDRVLRNNQYGMPNPRNEYLVDEAQTLLSIVLGINIKAMTVNVRDGDLKVVPFKGEN